MPRMAIKPHDAGEPARFIYGRRMGEALAAATAPVPLEPLRIAVRGQHIERWLSPRRASQKQGWLFSWRNAAKETPHGTLLTSHGGLRLRQAVIARVGVACAEGAVAQRRRGATLEDVACLVFSPLLLAENPYASTPAKVFDILLKVRHHDVAARPRGRTVSASPRRFSHSTSMRS